MDEARNPVAVAAGAAVGSAAATETATLSASAMSAGAVEPQAGLLALAPNRWAAGESFTVLGVESSCDETGVGITRVTMRENEPPLVELLADQVASSMEEHRRFGGVVPEIASRAHLEALLPTMRAALAEAGIEKPDVVAATVGPGLAGSLLVGTAAAKAYAAGWGVPFYGVNHLAGHVAVDAFQHGAVANAIALLVSGGHTQLLRVHSLYEPMVEMGTTVDDAAGEAYDKVARLLNLGYPGGPVIDELAQRGNPQAIAFPRGMMRQQDDRYNFSFSGLKTAVARHVEAVEAAGETVDAADLCASFQEAVADVLTAKALRACQDTGASILILGGGVAANSRLRALAHERCEKAGIALRVPGARYCTDNGAMIAAAASYLIAHGANPTPLTCAVNPGLPVETSLVQG